MAQAVRLVERGEERMGGGMGQRGGRGWMEVFAENMYGKYMQIRICGKDMWKG